MYLSRYDFYLCKYVVLYLKYCQHFHDGLCTLLDHNFTLCFTYVLCNQGCFS